MLILIGEGRCRHWRLFSWSIRSRATTFSCPRLQILNELLSYNIDKPGSSYTTKKLFKQYKVFFIFSYLSVEKWCKGLDIICRRFSVMSTSVWQDVPDRYFKTYTFYIKFSAATSQCFSAGMLYRPWLSLRDRRQRTFPYKQAVFGWKLPLDCTYFRKEYGQRLSFELWSE